MAEGKGRKKPVAQRSKGSVGKAHTRQLLLDVAERLFADHGFDGISLRQIGTASGQGNTAAIHYHFGGKESLVRAVMVRRAERFEKLRQNQLQKVLDRGKPWDLIELLKVAFLPLYEADENGSRYLSAKLNLHYRMSSYYSYPDPVEAGNARLDSFWMLLECLPFLSEVELEKRLIYLTGMFSIAVVERARRNFAQGKEAEDPEFFEDIFRMMSAIIQARV